MQVYRTSGRPVIHTARNYDSFKLSPSPCQGSFPIVTLDIFIIMSICIITVIAIVGIGNAELRSVENALAFSTSSSSEMLAATAAFLPLTFSFLLAFPLRLFLRCNQLQLFTVPCDYLFP